MRFTDAELEADWPDKLEAECEFKAHHCECGLITPVESDGY